MGDELHELRTVGEDRGDARAMISRPIRVGGIGLEGMAKPEQRFEVISFLHQLRARHDAQFGQLPAALLALAVDPLELPRDSSHARQKDNHQSGPEAGDHRLAPTPAAGLLQ